MDDGVALWSLELLELLEGELLWEPVELAPVEDDGLALWSLELLEEGDVLWELLLELEGDVVCELLELEGDALCELLELEADGVELEEGLFWVDELELLLGVVELELLGEVELLLPVWDELVAAGLVD